MVLSQIRDGLNDAATRIQVNSPIAAAGSFIIGRETDYDPGAFGTIGDVDSRTDDATDGYGGVITDEYRERIQEAPTNAVNRVRDAVPGAGMAKLVVVLLFVLVGSVALGQLFNINVGGS